MKEILKFPALVCCVVAFVMQVVLVIIITHGMQKKQGWLVTPIDNAKANRNAVVNSLVESWTTEPFTDIRVIDTTTTSNDQVLGSVDCPDTHPHEVFRDVWPGTTFACDCILPGKEREYELDMECGEHYRTDDNKNPMAECFAVGAIHPVILNRINGLKICGAKGQDMTLQKVQRPVKSQDTG